jgi:hypothetical protein
LLGYPKTKALQVGQFFFKNYIYKLQEVFSEHGIRVFPEKGHGSFQRYLRQTRCAKNIPKTVLKIRLKTKDTTYTLIS